METSEYIKMIEFMYKYLLCVLKQQNIVSPHLERRRFGDYFVATSQISVPYFNSTFINFLRV